MRSAPDSSNNALKPILDDLQPGQLAPSLDGTERVTINAGGANVARTTTQAIANLGAAPPAPVVTFSGAAILFNDRITCEQIRASTIGVDGTLSTSIGCRADVIDFGNSAVTSVTIAGINFISSSGVFNGSHSGSLTHLSLPGLVELEGGAEFVLNNCASLVSLSAPLLRFIGDAFIVANCTALPALSLPSLVRVGLSSDLDCSGCTSLTSIDLPALQTVGAKLNASGDTSLTSLNVPVLMTLGDQLNVGGTALTTLSAPNLGSVGTVVWQNCASLTTINLPNLIAVNGDVIGANAALTQASVDGILVKLASLDGTGGTTSYDNHSIDVSGGTSSAPGASGTAAITTLQGRGNTVTTN